MGGAIVVFLNVSEETSGAANLPRQQYQSSPTSAKPSRMPRCGERLTVLGMLLKPKSTVALRRPIKWRSYRSGKRKKVCPKVVESAGGAEHVGSQQKLLTLVKGLGLCGRNEIVAADDRRGSSAPVIASPIGYGRREDL